MGVSWSERLQRRLGNPSIRFAILGLAIVFSNVALGQTAATGALAGKVLDPSGAVIPGAEVHLVSPQTGDIAVNNFRWRWGFPFSSANTRHLRAASQQNRVRPLPPCQHKCSRNGDGSGSNFISD